MNTTAATAPAINFIDTAVFNSIVDGVLEAVFTAQSEAAEMNAPDIDREKLDQRVTEVLLASNIWPRSWLNLMPDSEKAALVSRIVAERKVGGERT